MKLTKKSVFAISAFFFLFVLLVIFQSKLGLCAIQNGYSRNCLFSSTFTKMIGNSFFDLAGSLFLISLIALFVRESVFRTWFQFAKWWIPASFLLVSVSPDGSHGFFPALFTKESMSLWTAGLFLITSLILIIKKSIQLRGK
jgi:ABC-type Fe3+ transport system permease subunit